MGMCQGVRFHSVDLHLVLIALAIQGVTPDAQEGDNSVRTFDPIFAYFSPETLLPATSIVATIAGIVMMLGRGSLRLVFRSTQRALRRPARIAGTSEPHVHLHEDARSKTAGH
jgi:hypothetical protein